MGPETTASLLGLLAATGYGLGDFIGGMVSRRVHFAIVSVIAGASSLVVMAIVVLLLLPADPTPSALLWGAVSGVGTALGTLALFRGLSRGRMGVVAPISALTAAAIPVIVGVALGERPALIAWLGVILAVPAIWLVSAAEDPDHPAVGGPNAGRLAPSVTDGLLAGSAFALIFIGLGLAGDDSGLWPVLANEFVALVILGIAFIAMLPRIERRSPAALDVSGATAIGILGAGASVAYLLATSAGLLSIVVVLTALYPAVTVVLAVLVTHESIGRRQAVGLGLAGLAIALIVLA